MTPEQEARISEIAERCFSRFTYQYDCCVIAIKRALAEPLLNGRDAALEQAALACEAYGIEVDGKFYGTSERKCAIAIRALKSGGG